MMTLPKPDAPEAPKYWAYEASGVLAQAIVRYLKGDHIQRDIPLIRAYFKQWVDSPVWDMNPLINDSAREALQALRADVDRIATFVDIAEWLDAAESRGMDPL